MIRWFEAMVGVSTSKISLVHIVLKKWQQRK